MGCEMETWRGSLERWDPCEGINEEWKRTREVNVLLMILR
jgi:hypothetical protein